MRRTLTYISAAWLSAILSLDSSTASAATIFADARADYAEGSTGQTTAAFNGGQGLSDTFGTGRWNYYESDNANIGATANEALLDVGTPGNLGTTGYGGGGNAGGFDLPGVAETKLFNTAVPTLANELALHPDNGAGVGRYVVLRWTAGAGESGLRNIFGYARNEVEGGDGTIFSIRHNGTSVVYTSPTLGLPADGAQANFSFFQLLAPGDTIDFVLDNIGGYSNDETHISATIVPEPSSLLLLTMSALSLYRLNDKRRGRFGR